MAQITPAGTVVTVVNGAAPEMRDAAQWPQAPTPELISAAFDQFPCLTEYLAAGMVQARKRDRTASRTLDEALDEAREEAHEWERMWRYALLRAMLHSSGPYALRTAPAGEPAVLGEFTLRAAGLVLDLAGSGLRIEREIEWNATTDAVRSKHWLVADSGPVSLELTPDAITRAVQAAAEVAA